MEKPSYLVDSNTIISASKDPNGEIARWLELQKPFVIDLSERECLYDWPKIDNPERAFEKKFIEKFFAEARNEGRYIESASDQRIYLRATYLNKSHNIKPADAFIAATAEIYGYILVTADHRKDFMPRLEKLNQQGLGNFKLQPYEYNTRIDTFREWNEAYQKGRSG
jgi:predicted nucleic acid-binding protein